jgi:hypothetical protein
LRLNQLGDPSLRLMQEYFVTQHGAKLFGPIVTGDSSREREQSLSVSTSQNQRPAPAERIASIEFH